MEQTRDSPGANSTQFCPIGKGLGSNIVCHDFGDKSVPSGIVTTSLAKTPAATGADETFFRVTVISNGTPGSTVSNGSVSVVSTAREGSAASAAVGISRRRANAVVNRFMVSPSWHKRIGILADFQVF